MISGVGTLAFCETGNKKITCINDGVLLSSTIEFIDVYRSPNTLGEWELPLSPQKPEILTRAKIQLQLEKIESTSTTKPSPNFWTLWVRFSFPDSEQPVGIPFTFPYMEISWKDARGNAVFHPIDFSNACQYPGRSLFPNQNWSVTVPLEVESEPTVFSNFKIKLWGARN